MSLKELIKEKGKTQQQIADELGYHQTLVSQWCHGKTRPPLHAVVKLAKILEVSLETVVECVK